MPTIELNLRKLHTEIQIAEMIKEKNELILQMYEEIKSLQSKISIGDIDYEEE